MANMMGKIGEKLHMGGHKKEEHEPTPVAPAGYAHDPNHPGGVAGATPAGAAPGAHQEGFMDKMKNKVKGGKDKTKDKTKAKAHGEDSSSSSSSESDGEGGRRKKKVVAPKVVY